jgi:hypothetical protein
MLFFSLVVLTGERKFLGISQKYLIANNNKILAFIRLDLAA